MPENIHVDQDVLSNAAAHHRQTAAYLATVADSNDGVRATLESLGPIYAELRATAEDLLDARKSCYEDQAQQHSEMSGNLDRAVATWDAHEADAAGAFRDLTDRP